LVHGRWGYRRIGLFICYYFYKNVILVFCEMWFAAYNGYSGQIFFLDWLPMLYNAFWTSWPCIFTYIMERDVDYDRSMAYPALYKAGHKKHYFNFKLFWKWMVVAIFHGSASFFITQMGLVNMYNDTGLTATHWQMSTVTFSICIHLATYKLYLESTYWNAVNM
jgi:phospholipid-transporting ATPase